MPDVARPLRIAPATCLVGLMFDASINLIGIVLFVLAIPLVGFPLLIYGTQRFQVEATIVPFDVGDYDWPPEISDLFERSIPALEGLGFETVAGLFLPEMVPSVKSAIVLMAHRGEQDAAIVTAIFGLPVQPGSPRSLHVEFSTEFEDRREVDTNNSRELSSFPVSPNALKSYLPQIEDPARLYEVHRAICRHYVRGTRKVFPLDKRYHGDGEALVRAGLHQEFQLAVDAGYLKSGDIWFRPTLLGACLMVWKELPPIRQLRQFRRTRRGNALLRELALAGTL